MKLFASSPFKTASILRIERNVLCEKNARYHQSVRFVCHLFIIFPPFAALHNLRLLYRSIAFGHVTSPLPRKRLNVFVGQVCQAMKQEHKQTSRYTFICLRWPIKIVSLTMHLSQWLHYPLVLASVFRHVLKKRLLFSHF